VTSLQLDDAVTFHGFVSHEEKVRILSSAWVVASTSVKEGWGISTIEANACGTSAVSADVPGLRDSVRDNETGLLYAHGDIDTLTSHLTRILREKATRERLQLGALRWASSFTWERSAREMLDRCEQVIAAHRGPWGIKRG
jgi:glycosyltransferase involved in cell wall biosynthesis